MLIKIDPEFEALIPKLRPEELAQLEASLRAEGCRDPLRQWGDILLDGHNRYRICKKFDIPFGVTPIELPDRDAALLWIEKNQLARRNVTDAYRKTLLQNIAEREARNSRKAQAAEAGKESGKSRRGEKTNVADQTVRKVQPDTRSKTRKRMSKELGVSERALKQAKIVNDAKETHPEVFAKVRDGKITSLAEAVREIEGPEYVDMQRKTLLRVLRAARNLTRAMKSLGDLEECDRESLDLVAVILRDTKPGLDQTITRLEAALAVPERIIDAEVSIPIQ